MTLTRDTDRATVAVGTHDPVRYEARIARRDRRCVDDDGTWFHGGDGKIRAGAPYVVARQYPGHDAGQADCAGHPVEVALCAECARGHGLGHLIDARLAQQEPGPDCMHGGLHVPAIGCPDCGRLSAHSWDTGGFYTQNGYQQSWGGTCKVHGEWSDSA